MTQIIFGNIMIQIIFGKRDKSQREMPIPKLDDNIKKNPRRYLTDKLIQDFNLNETLIIDNGVNELYIFQFTTPSSTNAIIKDLLKIGFKKESSDLDCVLFNDDIKVVIIIKSLHLFKRHINVLFNPDNSYRFYKGIVVLATTNYYKDDNMRTPVNHNK